MDFSTMDDAELLALYKEVDNEVKEESLAVFCCYNCRDVEVITRLDAKYRFIRTVNQMAHESTVPFPAMLGTVKYVETAITNYAHNVQNVIVPDKIINPNKNKKVEGAIVLTPRMGLHEWVGSVDLTSLYPSIMRALNMSPETFIGQFREGDDVTYGERAWYAIWKKENTKWSAFIDGEIYEMSGIEWNKMLREKNWALSAIGTIFNQEKPGIVASVLGFWFQERKRLQAEKKRCAKLADDLRKNTGVIVDDNILKQLK